MPCLADKPPALALVQTGSTMALLDHLASYQPGGQADHRALIQLPAGQRIAVLAQDETSRREIFAAVTGYAAKCMAMLRQPPPETVVDRFTLEVLQTAGEDGLVMEDVLIFLDQLVTGKRGTIYGGLDLPTMLEKFEEYRQEKYKARQDMRYERDANLKASGDPARTSQDVDRQAHHAALADHLKNLYSHGPKTDL